MKEDQLIRENARLRGEMEGLRLAINNKNFHGVQSSMFGNSRSDSFWDWKTIRVILSVVAIIFLINHFGGKFVSDANTVTGYAGKQHAEPVSEQKQDIVQTRNEYLASTVSQSDLAPAVSQPASDSSNYYSDLK